MPDLAETPDRFEQLLRNVNHKATSIAKYRGFERYLAETLDIPAANIYTAYVSKQANFDVRMTQSTSRAASSAAGSSLAGGNTSGSGR